MNVSLLPALRKIDARADVYSPIRWRGVHSDQHPVTLDFDKHADCRFWLKWSWHYSNVEKYQGYLQTPDAGIFENGKLDWAIVSDWESSCETEFCPQAYQSFLQEHACKSLESFVQSGVSFEPSDVRTAPAARMSCLSIEVSGGAVWRLWADSSALKKLWAVATGKPPLQPLHTSRFSTLFSIPVNWQFQIPLSQLTLKQIEQLEVGCLLIIDTRSDVDIQQITVLGCTVDAPIPRARGNRCTEVANPLSSLFRQAPVVIRAALMLRVVRTQLCDRLDFLWGHVLAPPSCSGDKFMQNPTPASADFSGDVQVRLQCVIGTRTLSLADVLNLKSGDVMGIHDFPLPHVQLLIDGRTVGSGELVRCADTLAVQIVEWFERSDDVSDPSVTERPVSMAEPLGDDLAIAHLKPTDSPE